MSAWKEYEMTLPLSVKQIVGSKYLSSKRGLIDEFFLSLNQSLRILHFSVSK